MALKKSHRDFRNALKSWDASNPARLEWANQHATRRALYAAWWFIENVNSEDDARPRIFFELREMVRDTQ